MSRTTRFGLPSAPGERRVVVALAAASFLLWIGGSAVLPLLPTYLRAHGSTPGLVGLVMASYFAAGVLTQYPAGRISDWLGRRVVLMTGLVVFAGGSVGFAYAAGPGLAILFRSCQGIGAGAVTVAAAATVGATVTAAERGGSFGALYGSQMLALAVGPLVGSLIGTASMRLLFLLAAGTACIALVPLGRIAAGSPGSDGPESAGGARAAELSALSAGSPGGLAHRLRRSSLVRTPAIVGSVIQFFSMGILFGVYESCWTLLLRLRGTSGFDIGLSWTMFALPFALLSIPAGRVADRFDRRVLALGALALSAGFCSLYPFFHSVPMLIGFGSLEAACSVVGAPAAVLILTEATPPAVLGGAQGALETGRTAATAAAAAAGALFALDPAIPFTLAAFVGLVGCVITAVLWRGVPGYAAHAYGSESIPARSEPRPTTS